MSSKECEAEWERIDNATDEDDKDQLGPEFSKLRLPIHVEDYVIGEAEVSHSKKVELTNKPKKITKLDDVKEAQQAVTRGHAAFGDEMFANAGGRVVAMVGRLGSSSTVGTTGETWAGTNSCDGATEGGFAVSITETDDDKTQTPKKKIFDAPAARAELKNFIHERLFGNSGVKAAQELALTEAQDMLQTAEHCSDEFSGLNNWIQILGDRIAWLRHVAVGDDHGPELSGDVLEADKDFQLIKKAQQLTTQAKDATGKMTSERCMIIINGLREIADDIFNSRVFACLAEFGYEGTTFFREPDFEEMAKAMHQLMVVRVKEIKLSKFIELKHSAKTPLPVENIQDIGSP